MTSHMAGTPRCTTQKQHPPTDRGPRYHVPRSFNRFCHQVSSATAVGHISSTSSLQLLSDTILAPITKMASPTSLPTTMRAWQYTTTTTGLENHLTLSPSVPLPPLPASRPALLIRVISASINPADYKVPELGLPARALIRTPAIPGMDFCGRVVQTSPPTSNFSPGDLVFGRVDANQFGSCAEYLVAAPHSVARLPEGVDPDEGAATGTAGMTAWQVIAPHVKEGDGVFINGGGGGTGTFGIQIAKALGCRVVVSCSGGKAELCRRLGADEVVDYTREDVSKRLCEMGQGFKLCVDNVAVPEDLYKLSDGFLVPDGLFSQVGGPVSLGAAKLVVARKFMPSFLGGGKRRYEVFTIKKGPESLVQLAEWNVAGKVKPVIEEVFPMEELPAAFKKLKTGRCYGKLVIRVEKRE